MTNNREEQVAEIWQALHQVKDPEIPVISIIEMGIVRDVAFEGEVVRVRMTPTFAGCPALHVMKEDIEACLLRLGFHQVKVEVIYHPPWTTDWIVEEARAKLKAFGLAPPPRHGGRLPVTFFDLAACPYCDSEDTAIKNSFGPTLCRSIYYCNSCQQPFEQFKAL